MKPTESLADVMSMWFQSGQYGRVLRLAHATLGAHRLGAEMWLWIAVVRAHFGQIAAARHACLMLIDSNIPKPDRQMAEQLFTSLQAVPTRFEACVTDLQHLPLSDQREWVAALLTKVPVDPLRLPVLFILGTGPYWSRLASVPQCMPVERTSDDDPLWSEEGVLFRQGLSEHHMITPEAALALWTDRLDNRPTPGRGDDAQVQL